MKILIAEDQAASAHSLRRVLERLGHEAAVAADGESAWAKILRGDVSVLIVDWEMPACDGPELCRRVRSLGSHPYHYVIAVTSQPTREDRLAGLRAGADDFLIKPVDPDELRVRLDIARRILEVHEALARKNALLAELATTDPLTGVRNRRRFREDLDALVALAARTEMPLSLVMLDVDRFKSYNDDFGHPAGDEVLRGAARLLRAGVRDHDAVARLGGEEFAVLLPSTGADVARSIAERLRAAIAAHPWPHRPITVSLGVSTLDLRLPDGDLLIEKADRALYRSKDAGRDRVHHADEDRGEPECAPHPSRSPRIVALDGARGLIRADLFVAADGPADPWLLTTWRHPDDFERWRSSRPEPLNAMPGDPAARPFAVWIRPVRPRPEAREGNGLGGHFGSWLMVDRP